MRAYRRWKKSQMSKRTIGRGIRMRFEPARDPSAFLTLKLADGVFVVCDFGKEVEVHICLGS